MTPVQPINPFDFFVLMSKASLFSTGGLGNLPILHSDFLARGWCSDSDFAQAITIGQLSPGPTGLWVVSFGYLTYGIAGALLTALAITLPPLLILVIKHLHGRVEHNPAVQGFVRGMGLAALGSFGYVLTRLFIQTGISYLTIGILLSAAVLATFRKIPSVAIIAAAAMVGVLVHST